VAESFGEFEIIEKIGQGGNAEVYKARTDESAEEVVALKLPQMHEFRTVEAGEFDAFIKEAETWSGVDDHEHVVSVLDWGERPHPWIAIEYMNARSLRERTPLSSGEAYQTVLAIASAVQHVHRYGVTHGDLKPENILFDKQDGETVAKVTDWGLAKVLLDRSQSKDGMTPEYAAPEQFTGDPNDAEDYQLIDVYQLGAVAYEAFTGQPPFEGSAFEIMEQIKSERPTPPSDIQESLPDGLDAVILRAMSKRPGERYESVLQFTDALEKIDL
jgi:serine/threonine protein kinase